MSKQPKLYIVKSHSGVVHHNLNDYRKVIAVSFQQAIDKAVESGFVTSEQEVYSVMDDSEVIL